MGVPTPRTALARQRGIDEEIELLKRAMTRTALPIRLSAQGQQATDWNDAVLPGFFWGETDAANAPTDDQRMVGEVLVYGSQDMVVQNLYQVDSTDPDLIAAGWRRFRTSSGAWTPWVAVDGGGSGGVITWASILDKPTSFPPSAHTHAAADVTSGTFDAARIPVLNIDSKTSGVLPEARVGGVAWGNVSGKPTTFPPSAHTHTSSEITDFSAAADARVDAVLDTTLANRMADVFEFGFSATQGDYQLFMSPFAVSLQNGGSGDSMSYTASGLNWGSGATNSYLEPETPTASRTLTLPDKSGTIATRDEIDAAIASPMVLRGYASGGALPDPMSTPLLPEGARAFTEDGNEFIVAIVGPFRVWERVAAQVLRSDQTVTPATGWTIGDPPSFQIRGGTVFGTISLTKTEDGPTSTATGSIASQVMCDTPSDFRPWFASWPVFITAGTKRWTGRASSQIVLDHGAPSQVLSAGSYVVYLNHPLS